MTSSGTEASMSAIRLARAATGRDPIVKFAGAYHGHVDGLLAEAGSGMATAGVPASPGVTEAQAARHGRSSPGTTSTPSPRRSTSTRPRRSSPSRSRRTWASSPRPRASSRASAKLADESGALLILDEVITGFRVARGGAQELLGVSADLTVMGKVLGGGLPAAAYGGPRELMERVAPAGDVYQAGTLSGNPLAVAAGLATLRRARRRGLRAPRRDHRRGSGTGSRRRRATGRCRVVVRARACSRSSSAPRRRANFAEASACDTEAYGRFCRALLERGVYPPPSQFEAWFPSLAHDDEAIEQTLAAAGEAFEEALG